MGADSERASGRDDVISLLTLDPTTRRRCCSASAGAREGARRVRDVFSAEMWEAINTFHLGLLRRDMSAALRSGPYSLYAYVRERCALFWGVTDRTMLRDEARAFLEAGAAIEAGDMVLRMLRVALPTDEAEPTEADPRDGQAVALLQAMGGFQAFRRAIPAPPKASLVGSFLLYERAYPDSVAHSVSALHDALTAADSSYRSSAPVLRLSRLMADLDFRSRSVEGAGPLAQTLGPVQRELELVDGDIALRYFGGASAPVARLADRLMHFAIRYLTEYRYDGPVTDNLNALRVTPATTATQRVDDFGVRVEPQTRLHQHLDYYGTSVIEFGIAKPHDHALDRRPRARGDGEAARPARGRLAGDRGRRLPRPRDRVPAPLRGRAGRPARRRARRARARRHAAGHARARRAGDPGPLRVPRGRDLRRLEGRGPARRGRRRLPGLRAPRARAAAPQRDRRPLRLRLPVRAARGPRGGRRLRRGRDARLAGGARAARTRAAASRCGSASTRRTAAWPASTT